MATPGVHVADPEERSSSQPGALRTRPTVARHHADALGQMLGDSATSSTSNPSALERYAA
jgi:hypothetical protein